MFSLEEKQKIEIEFWRDSKDASPKSDSINSIVYRVASADIFLECLNRHQNHLNAEGKVLELGAGQGWASCIYKRLYPKAHLTTTDISEFAIKSLSKCEYLYEVKIDSSYACTSYETKEKDSSVDLVFCYAAAHHFRAHKRTLKELNRILKPKGVIIYFHEPVTPKYLYFIAYWRVNRLRPEVPEDVIITSEIDKLAKKSGFELLIDYFPYLKKKRPCRINLFFYLISLPFPPATSPLYCYFNIHQKINNKMN